MYRAIVITISDSSSKGERVDKSGPLAKDILKENDFEIVFYKIIPDEFNEIVNTLNKSIIKLKPNIIITTGGTGFSQRDITPEATLKVIERNAPGISEAARAYSMTKTKRAMLSRGVSGIKENTLIVNLPGSPKAVKEILEYIINDLKHGIDILIGKDSNCGKIKEG